MGNCTCCQSVAAEALHESQWIESGNVIHPLYMFMCDIFTYSQMWFSDISHIKCKHIYDITHITQTQGPLTCLFWSFRLYHIVLISMSP